MFVSINWIKDYVDLSGLDIKKLINSFTLATAEVEDIIVKGEDVQNVVVGEILSPVGAGATSHRTRTAWEIIEQCHPTVIRGNGSEIMALINADVKSKGVDSTASSDDALEAAKALAVRTGAVVVISGPTDYITDGTRTETITNGHPIMTAVTGMGCTASAVVGAFVATGEDALLSAKSAASSFGKKQAG